MSLHGILRPWKERYAENGEGIKREARKGVAAVRSIRAPKLAVDVSRDGLFIYLFVCWLERFDGCKKGLRGGIRIRESNWKVILG